MKKYILITVVILISTQLFMMTASAEGLDRHIPTQQEVVTYLKKHKIDMTQQQKYITKPTAEKAGEVDTETAIHTMNLIRLLAGLPEVVENKNMNNLAQHASYIMKRSGQFSHHLTVPKGMSKKDVRYQKGELGARSSNLMLGSENIPYTLMYAYMFDEDASNIDDTGHRRWLLNPTMRSVGFGYVEGYSATYVLDNKKSINNELPNVYNWNASDLAEISGRKLIAKNTKIAWPAENMPIEYMSNDLPFSLSLSDDFSIDKPVITMKNIKTGSLTVINSSKLEKNQHLSISSEKYGYINALIWRPNPKKINYKAGETYAIHIDGITKDGIKTPIDYQVKFFKINNFLQEISSEQNYTVFEGQTFTVNKGKNYDYSQESVDFINDYYSNDFIEWKDRFKYKALKQGKTTIVFKSWDDDVQKLKVNITILANPKWVRSIKAPAKITIKKGKSMKLNASVLPKTATNKKLKYDVWDPNIITISKTGIIKAKSKGTSYVYINGARNSFKRVTVTVN